MNRRERAAFHRLVQKLVDAEIEFSWRGTKSSEEQAALRTDVLKARLYFKNALDRHTDPVVPPTKKE